MALDFDFKALGEPIERLWPVTVNEPMDGGTVQESEFTARFKIVSEEESNAAIEASGKKGGDPFALFRLVWVGLATKHGDLTEDVFLKMLAKPYVRQAVLMAYFRCAQGAAAKN